MEDDQVLYFLQIAPALARLTDVRKLEHFPDQYLRLIAAGSTSAVHGYEQLAGELIGQQKSQHPPTPAGGPKEQVAHQRFYCTSNQL
jgi:hypothetical protein